MVIKNKRVLVLGGWGLVGMAICKKLIRENPEEIIILSLKEQESRDAVAILSKQTSIKLTPIWGNIFTPVVLKDKSRTEILEEEENRQELLDSVLNELNDDILKDSFLYQAILRSKPDIVIDSINSATGLAYQNIFSAGSGVKQKIEQNLPNTEPALFRESVEKLMVTMYMPQLIRHIQILYEAMKKVGTGMYIKIGTSGTGGMGLNIPYTHSEEKPSRMLLSKSAVAGAHSMLLWLMARTPDAPITKEIKPTAAIAWKRIAYDEIRKGGKPVEMYDCLPDKGVKLEKDFQIKMKDGPWNCTGHTLKSVFIDTGENGIFSVEEFSAITSRGQMEFITPEEIATNVIHEIFGRNTGHDIVNALDNATMGPTYRAGSMRNSAIRKMNQLKKETDSNSVAFELLGPPRLSKLLFEGELLRRCGGSIDHLLEQTAQNLSAEMDNLIRTDARLRSEILSIGIPILMRDGKTLLRGPEIKSPSYHGHNELDITGDKIDKWADEGWVDLREKNVEHWLERLQLIFEELNAIPEGDTSSLFDRNLEYWRPEEEIQIGKVVGWIFLSEDEGIRMKE